MYLPFILYSWFFFLTIIYVKISIKFRINPIIEKNISFFKKIIIFVVIQKLFFEIMSDNQNNIERKIDCLDKGFVRLVDFMGSDDAIVQAARVSYGKGTKSVSQDRGLIRYLMRHKHTSPFEMVEFKFHVKLPIFVARQWIRHRTANVNEYSGRYSEMTDEFYVPSIDQIRPQSTMNKQGRGDESFPENEAKQIAEDMNKTQQDLFTKYNNLLEKDLARELARINLPLSNYTEWYWKIDLHNLFHFLRLRIDSHAQFEIRVYGEAIAAIIKEIVPIAYEAFEDYVLNGMYLSAQEKDAVLSLIDKEKLNETYLQEKGLTKREIREFLDKINNF
jgi:thymidylate synthase (FAD)